MVIASQATPAGHATRTSFGAPSWKYSETGAAMRWDKGAVNIALDPSIATLGPEAEDAVRTAIGSWVETDARLPRVSIERSTKKAEAKRDGVNRVLFAPIELPGHKDDLAITVTYSDADSGAILEADIIINARHRFSKVSDTVDDHGDARDGQHKTTSHPACEHTYDLQSVTTHELGHFFGLGEDTEDPESSMYFRTSTCETKKRTLSSVDSVELVSLYDAEADAQEPGVGCSLASPQPETPGATGLIAAVVLLALALRR
jgi:predicted Zn-dependent protease